MANKLRNIFTSLVLIGMMTAAIDSAAAAGLAQQQQTAADASYVQAGLAPNQLAAAKALVAPSEAAEFAGKAAWLASSQAGLTAEAVKVNAIYASPVALAQAIADTGPFAIT